MNSSTYIDGNDLYLSKRYLKGFFSLKTIEYWNEKSGVVYTEINGDTYFLYKSIPLRSKRKLPHPDKIIALDVKINAESKVKDILHDAYYFKFSDFKYLYESGNSLPAEKITKFAKIHSVFHAILELKRKEGFKNTSLILQEFNKLFPGKYSSTNALCNAIKDAVNNGIMSVAFDKRTLGNNEKSKKANNPQVEYLMQSLVACNGKFTNGKILDKANAYFEEKGLKQRGLSWVKKQRGILLKNPEVYKSRYGSKELNKIMPYASMKHANLTHIQWQVDGWNLPFWEERIVDGKKKVFNRSVLVIVIDNCSKKIIGYEIGHTENSEIIKNAIRKAVDNTGVLPFELVMDHHSFTKTKAALNFETLLTKVGSILTKTSNPQHKAIIERYFQKIDLFCKEYPGWLGKNVRSKSIENIATDEQYAKYAKEFKSHSEVISIATSVIEKYNNDPQKNLNNLSPNQSFIENQHPNPIKLNQFIKAGFLPNQCEKIVRRNQITIMRGIEKFEYQLPASLFQKWNNETVLVVYDNLADGIYLFDLSNGEGIIHLHLKGKINNSRALQTSDDINALHRNKGRLNGIQTQAKKQLENTRDAALNIDPEAYEKVNALITPKDIKKELLESSDLRYQVENNGVTLNELTFTEQSFDLPASLKPAKKNNNPFTVKNHVIKIITPGTEPESD